MRLSSGWHIEGLLDFDDAGAYPFGLSNNVESERVTSLSCLENNHSLQSTVKASVSCNCTQSVTNLSGPACIALHAFTSKSHTQLTVLSEARVQAMWRNAETYGSQRMPLFHQMFKRDHRPGLGSLDVYSTAFYVAMAISQWERLYETCGNTSSVSVMLVSYFPPPKSNHVLNWDIFYDHIVTDILRRIIMAALIMMYVIYFLWNMCIGSASSIILTEHFWMVLNCQWHRLHLGRAACLTRTALFSVQKRSLKNKMKGKHKTLVTELFLMTITFRSE